MKRLVRLLTFTLLAFGLAGVAQAKTVNLKASELHWEGSKITGDKHNGGLKFKEVSLTEKDGKITGGTFIVDINSLTVNDITDAQWHQKFLKHMKSEDFFEIDKFPTAKLVIEKIENGKASGQLTIKGKTNPITLDFEEKEGTYTTNLSFDRTKFDMIYGSKNFFKNLGDKVINDEVKLTAKIVLK